MILRGAHTLFAAILLFQALLSSALTPSDIPSDTPIASLLASAKSNLAAGQSQDALIYYDTAVARDPDNYLTVFQRGATYLSLGKTGQATADFDRALALKPDFEGALLQRAKIRSRAGDWQAAQTDYAAANKKDTSEWEELVAAEAAAERASTAEKEQDWATCVAEAGAAIMVASTSLPLRQRRARCRFEKGEVEEAASDLQHVSQMAPGLVEPHLQISANIFFSVGDTEKGLSAIRTCLHSDPDSKPCKALYRREKRVEKAMKQMRQYQDKKQFLNAAKVLVGDGEDPGLLADVQSDFEELQKDGHIHKKSPTTFYNYLTELTCEFYNEMNNKKKAAVYCENTLKNNPDSLPALLFKARRQIDAEEYEAAMSTLNHAKEHHSSSQTISQLLQKAQTALHRAKQKDYYKVLGVDREADERTIRRAYRTLIKKHHPDKADAQGMNKAEAEKKTAAINEAYEVLSDPEKRAQFDRGDDPNSTERQGSPFQGSPFPGGQQFMFQSGGQQFFHAGGGAPFNFPGGFQFQGM